MVEPRLLPHNKEAEAAVLGRILLSGSVALAEVLELIDEDSFYVPANQATFRAMRLLDERGEGIDVVTLHAQLRKTGEAELVGGIEGLARLDQHATAHNVKAHAELVRGVAVLRGLHVATRDIAESAMVEGVDHGKLIRLAEKAVAEASTSARRDGPRSAKDLMIGVFQGITERQRSTEAVTGVASGFYELDEMTSGFQPGDLIILAARPSMGKTAAALNIALNACVMPRGYVNAPVEKQPPRFPVLFFSLEMGANQLMERALCSEASVDYTQLRRGGRMSEPDFRELIASAERVARSPLYIDDSATMTISQIKGTAQRWRDDPRVFPEPSIGADGKPVMTRGLIVVDYLQLAKGASKGTYGSREQEISEISRGLKAMAKSLGLPVIALAQLNRAVDARADHRPQLSDLRESGAIEQDADVIMFLYREEKYLPPTATVEQREHLAGKAELIIGKQRNGPTGTVNLVFTGKHTRFDNAAREFGP